MRVAVQHYNNSQAHTYLRCRYYHDKKLKLAGAVAGGTLLLVLVAALRGADTRMAQLNEGNIGLIENLGKVLFTEYVVPFEIASILFLSAMVGAVVIGKRDKRSPVAAQIQRQEAMTEAMNG